MLITLTQTTIRKRRLKLVTLDLSISLDMEGVLEIWDTVMFRPKRRPYDFRSAHQLTPIKKRLIITELLFKRIKNKEKLIVTIVPILPRGMMMTNIKKPEDVIKLESISLIMYDSPSKR